MKNLKLQLYVINFRQNICVKFIFSEVIIALYCVCLLWASIRPVSLVVYSNVLFPVTPIISSLPFWLVLSDSTVLIEFF